MSAQTKKKRKRNAADGDDLDDEQQLARDDEEEDAEVQRRLAERRSAENERMSALYDNFISIATPEQLERFEHWKRSKFPRASMRKLMSDTLSISSERGAIVLAAVAKMFVGELVEGAREIMNETGATGPIQPAHLRRAHRRAQRAGTVPSNTRRVPHMFWRSDTGA